MADRTDTFYAATGAIHGYGAQLMKGNGASPTETFEAIAAVTSITPGAMTTADINRTHLRSPDAHHEHMPGLRDSGAFTAQLVWLPHEQSQSNAGGGSGSFTNGGLIEDWRNRTTHNWKIVLYADGSPSIDWPFTGYVSQFQPGEIGVNDKINASVSFQPTQAYDSSLP
jgi:hypothetical protein